MALTEDFLDLLDLAGLRLESAVEGLVFYEDSGIADAHPTVLGDWIRGGEWRVITGGEWSPVSGGGWPAVR